MIISSYPDLSWIKHFLWVFNIRLKFLYINNFLFFTIYFIIILFSICKLLFQLLNNVFFFRSISFFTKISIESITISEYEIITDQLSCAKQLHLIKLLHHRSKFRNRLLIRWRLECECTESLHHCHFSLLCWALFLDWTQWNSTPFIDV